MFLHRPEVYDPEDHPGEAEIIIGKNRNGPVGIVTLTWLRESMRFENFVNHSVADADYFANSRGNVGDSF